MAFCQNRAGFTVLTRRPPQILLGFLSVQLCAPTALPQTFCMPVTYLKVATEEIRGCGPSGSETLKTKEFCFVNFLSVLCFVPSR